MEDTLSAGSLESCSTTDDFFVVSGSEPQRRSDNTEEEVAERLREVLFEEAMAAESNMLNIPSKENPFDRSGNSSELNSPVKETDSSDHNFSACTPQFTLFEEVVYLGATRMRAPRSETEIKRHMAALLAGCQMDMMVNMSVAHTADGFVRLLEPITGIEIETFCITRILFCARGDSESAERCCFAFSCLVRPQTHISVDNSAATSSFTKGSEAIVQEESYQCHVFRTAHFDQVGRILFRFACTFRNIPNVLPSRNISGFDYETLGGAGGGVEEISTDPCGFRLSLDIKEDDQRGGFQSIPRDKDAVFKLRCNVERRIYIQVQQTSGSNRLTIERCFGLLVGPGRNLQHDDMILLEMTSMGLGAGTDRSYSISGNWSPTEPGFEVLNRVTEADRRLFMSIAVDLVVVGIQEPVRFVLECRARVFPEDERFWIFKKTPIVQDYYVHLKEKNDAGGTVNYDVVLIESLAEAERRMTLQLAGVGASQGGYRDGANFTPAITPTEPEAVVSEDDEPLQSGSGIPSMEITDHDLAFRWHEIVKQWQADPENRRPKAVTQLTRQGVPESLRAVVWLLLAGCQEKEVELAEAYRILITKQSPAEQTIERDVGRTFPAHEAFKDNGAKLEDLGKIAKAYSLYDEEVGYCQGMCHLAGALLLNLPEEQSFTLFVRIMFAYGVRELFVRNFEGLNRAFYQLERLLHDQLPDLHSHFQQLGVAAQMYASQWFITIFTAKFPLRVGFHIIDVFLSEGMDVMFKISLALLKGSRKDLLALDFEGVMKYFRVTLPKKYLQEEAILGLLRSAMSNRVSSNKLLKYSRQWEAERCAQLAAEDPLERIERELRSRTEENLRLEQENDQLATELMESKIQLRAKLDQASKSMRVVEDKYEIVSKELFETKKVQIELEEQRRNLLAENIKLKEMYRMQSVSLETQRCNAEKEQQRSQRIIDDYKQITSQLSLRLERQQTDARNVQTRYEHMMRQCEQCSLRLDEVQGANIGGDGVACVAAASTMLASSSSAHMFNSTNYEDGSFDGSGYNGVCSVSSSQVQALEVELAQTKLALVEAECRNQELVHNMQLQENKKTWLSKKLTSVRDVVSSKSQNAPAAGGGGPLAALSMTGGGPLM